MAHSSSSNTGRRFAWSHESAAAPVAQQERVYLTAAQVAQLLQIHPATVYRMAASDPSMPALKLGGVVRFPRERLLKWLQDREQGRPRMRRQMLSAPNSASVQGAASATGAMG